jgi:hypothetical protein
MSCSCECSIGPLYVGNTINVEITGLRNATSGAYINDATVTFSVKTLSGAIVDGLEDEAMSYISASDGVYRGTIPSDAPFFVGQSYVVEITATKSGVGVGSWRVESRAGWRSGC